MKLKELNTEDALNVLVKLTPALAEIAEDDETEKLLNTLHTKKKSNVFSRVAGLANSFVTVAFKNHREAAYTVLSVMTEKDIEVIKNQTVMETIEEARAMLNDPDLIAFFQQFMPQAKN